MPRMRILEVKRRLKSAGVVCPVESFGDGYALLRLKDDDAPKAKRVFKIRPLPGAGRCLNTNTMQYLVNLDDPK